MDTRRYFSHNFVSLLVVLLIFLTAPLRADVLNDINADTNSSGDWTAPPGTTVFATANVTRIATAEVFGAVLQESSTLFWTGSGAGANRALEYSAVSFDPSLKGAIVGIDYTVEHDRPAGFFSHPFRVTLVQNGRFYSYFGAGEHRDNTNDATFTMFSNSSTLATDWHEVTSASNDVPASNPDFSASGSPLTIALMTRHGSSGTSSQGFRSQFRNFTVTFRPVPEPVTFLIIDEDSIDNGNPPNFFLNGDVNDDFAEIGLRTQLPVFAANVRQVITLHTGEVGDEGWFALQTIPDAWAEAGPTADGLRNFVGLPSLPVPHDVGLGLGAGDDPEALLDKIPDVTPLRATGLELLEGKTVCAVVFDSDISINYDPLDGSLKGDNLGTVAFQVLEVRTLDGASSSSLPEVDIEILDAEEVCEGELALFTDAPEPISSSEPFDVE